jgi:solute carrier family 25 (mitochondrial phosphate transporter), member 23/24/25/41
MQMAGMKGTQFEYANTFDAIRRIVKQEGIHGLYKGMLPNILKVAPAISVSFVTYEAMKKVLSTT